MAHKLKPMFNVNYQRENTHVGWGRDKPGPPSSFKGSIPHDLNQLIFN